jgi:predicted membrane protein
MRFHGAARSTPLCNDFEQSTVAGAELDTSSLLWGLLFGSIGLGFLVYGRKQRAVVPLVCGLALMIFPYFISNTILLITIGIVLMAVPYFLRL